MASERSGPESPFLEFDLGKFFCCVHWAVLRLPDSHTPKKVSKKGSAKEQVKGTDSSDVMSNPSKSFESSINESPPTEFDRATRPPSPSASALEAAYTICQAEGVLCCSEYNTANIYTVHRVLRHQKKAHNIY